MPTTSLGSIPQIQSQHPSHFWGDPQRPLLIDVRTSLEFGLGHVPDAKNLSLQKLLFARLPGLSRWILPAWFRELPQDRPLAVICLSGHRSPLAAQVLLGMGFQQITNLEGGILTWKAERLPLTR